MEFLWTIVGGLAVVGITWIWKEIVPRIVTHVVRNEPRINGRWDTTFEEGGKTKHEKVDLNQKGHIVKGVLTLLEDGEESKYRLRGTFKHRILKATYESTDPKEYEGGAFALIYERGRLKGQYILFGPSSDELVSSEYIWERR